MTGNAKKLLITGGSFSGPSVVAYRGIVGLQSKYESELFGRQLAGRGGIRLPKNLFADRKISPLCSCEVLCNQFTTGTTEIVDAVGAILPYVNFPVRVGEFVDHFYGARFTGFSGPCGAPDG
jgi:hypothetical protein